MVSTHMLWNYKHFLATHHQAGGINDRTATDKPVLNFFNIILLILRELYTITQASKGLEHQYTGWKNTE